MLTDLYCSQPLRLLFPAPVRGEAFQAVLACVSGGVLGGDHLRIDVRADAGTRALVMGQAAEKIYRTAGPVSVIENDLTVGPGAWLEWLPQETILFDRARLRRSTTVRVDPLGAFLGGDLLVFGRTARGEHLTEGLVHDGWDIRGQDGTPIWRDVLHMDGDLAATLNEGVSFGGARAYATIVCLHAGTARLLAAARAAALGFADGGLRIGATIVRGILLVRFLSTDTLRLRQAYAAVWKELRHLASGLPARMPYLWTV